MRYVLTLVMLIAFLPIAAEENLLQLAQKIVSDKEQHEIAEKTYEFEKSQEWQQLRSIHNFCGKLIMLARETHRDVIIEALSLLPTPNEVISPLFYRNVDEELKNIVIEIIVRKEYLVLTDENNYTEEALLKRASKMNHGSSDQRARLMHPPMYISGFSREREIRAYMLEICKSDDYLVEMQPDLIRLLSVRRNKRLLPMLIRKIKHPKVDLTVKIAAVESIVNYDPEDYEEFLIERMKNSFNFLVKMYQKIYDPREDPEDKPEWHKIAKTEELYLGAILQSLSLSTLKNKDLVNCIFDSYWLRERHNETFLNNLMICFIVADTRFLRKKYYNNSQKLFKHFLKTQKSHTLHPMIAEKYEDFKNNES